MTDTGEKERLPEAGKDVPEEIGATGARLLDLEGRLAQKDEELSRSTARIVELEGIVARREGEVASLEQERSELRTTLAGAVTSYRSVVLQANAGIVEDLVSGDTVEAIDSSLAKAKALVGKVRQGLAMELATIRVPAGAPERTSVRISGLSPREKIQYGVVR